MTRDDEAAAAGGPSAVPRVVVDVSRYARPDLVLVDVLARVRLVAGRLGARLEVHGGGPELTQLLAFVGLLAVAPADPEPGEPAASEGGGQPEALEEPRVEEVMDVRHPAVPHLEHLDGPGHVTRPGGCGRLVLGEGG
jgi:hypothetical protein